MGLCKLWRLRFGLLVHMKQGWATPQRQEPWSLMRAVARMSYGICASNLFVLHLMSGFLYEARERDFI